MEWKKVNQNGEEWEPIYTDVLDHGFVGLVDFVGSDSSIINAARVSYGKGTKATRSDEGLIRYLMRHYHSTPFEMVDFTFHVKAPIFVIRQWQRHRTASMNEYSGRYSVMTDEAYIPHHSKTASQSVDNKQGRTETVVGVDDYNAVRTALDHAYDTSYQTYRYLCGPMVDPKNKAAGPVQAAAPDAIHERRKEIETAAMNSIVELRNRELALPENERTVFTEDTVQTIIRDWFTHHGAHVITTEYEGVARELARIVLPVATYTQMYWKANLHNIMHFLRLRADSHAQYEIRVYAEEMLKLIEPIVPMATRAFIDYRIEATNVSRMEKELIISARNGDIDITNNDDIEDFLENKGCSAGERREFFKRF